MCASTTCLEVTSPEAMAAASSSAERPMRLTEVRSASAIARIMPDGCHDHAGDERGEPADEQPGAGARGLGDPADDRRADRRRAEEDDGVERHDAAAHRRI